MAAPRFVNRDEELDKLLSLAERGSGVPVYLYGPEGCGKTRLLRVFVDRVKARRGFLAVYIDALEERDPGRAVAGSPELRKLVLEAARGASGPVGAVLAYLAAKVLSHAEKKLVEGKHLVLVVDDVAHPLGLGSVEGYVKTLLKLVEHDLPEKNPASVLIVASTSEGLSLERLRRHPTWAAVKLLWNLPRKGFMELARILRAPSREAVEQAWKLTGGNPRALIALATVYEWDASAWLRSLDTSIVRPLIVEVQGRGLLELLRLLAEDPDAAFKKPTRDMRALTRLLVARNMLVYKAVDTLAGTSVPRDRELGVGDYYAWQLPAYQRLLLRHLGADRG